MRLKLKKILAVFLTTFLIIPFVSSARVAAEDIVTIHYDGENNDGIGITTGGTFEAAARYPKTALQPNLGRRIKAVKVYFHDVCPTTLKLYKGTWGVIPENLVYSKSVGTTVGWNTFEIDEKILITDDDLWAGYEVTHVSGQFPAGIDSGPANPDGCYFRSDIFNNGAWMKLTDFGFNCNLNLRIELILEDTKAPVISKFSINDNQNITNNPAVNLNINAADDFTSIDNLKMRLSNNNTDWSEWEAYSSKKDWILSSGDGEKTVFIQVKDEKDNVAAGSDSIIMDTKPPVFSVSGNPAAWTNKNVTLKITASDEVSKLNDNGAYSFDGGKTWTKESSRTFTKNGTVNIKVRDNSGNTASKEIIIDKIDKIPPVITINPYPISKTDKSITVTASTNEGTLNATSHTFNKNGSFDFIAVDAAGNKTIKKITISNIVSGLPQTGFIFDFSLLVLAGMAMIILGFTVVWRKN